MLAHLLLTAVQSRILLALLLDSGLGTASLLEAVGISGKTWAREKEKLLYLGLVESKEKKLFHKKGVKVTVVHQLTSKGVDVAVRIRSISETISSVP